MDEALSSFAEAVAFVAAAEVTDEAGATTEPALAAAEATAEGETTTEPPQKQETVPHAFLHRDYMCKQR